MTARDALRSLLDSATPDGPPDPETGTEAEIAEYCGIKPATAPPDAVPVEMYRGEGRVWCARTTQEPDPPRRVVARFQLPAGGSEVLSNGAYADVLAAEYADLSDDQAVALALHRAGWLAADYRGLDSPLGPAQHDAPELLADAKEIVAQS